MAGRTGQARLLGSLTLALLSFLLVSLFDLHLPRRVCALRGDLAPCVGERSRRALSGSSPEASAVPSPSSAALLPSAVSGAILDSPASSSDKLATPSGTADGFASFLSHEQPSAISFAEVGGGEAKNPHSPPPVKCTIAFRGSVRQPPMISVTSTSPSVEGPFLLILRDRDPRGSGWIHGYQRGVHAGYNGPFGAGDEGEYVQCHPPSGSHIYDLLVFDGNYALGSKMLPIISTPWNNPARALGPEEKLIEDLSEELSSRLHRPKILARCSVTVSHEQVAAEEATNK